MFFLLRMCLGVVLAAGLGSAVVVPVALTSRGSESSTNSKGDNSARQASVNVSKCSSTVPSDGWSGVVVFGAGDLSEVCWDSGSPSQSYSDPDKGDISKVLQRFWGSPSFANLGLTGMTDYCDSDGENQSVETGTERAGYRTLWKGNNNACSGTEYLRLGDRSNTFLKKSQDSGSSAQKLWLCASDCWEGTGFQSGDLSTAQASVKEKQGKWSELKFYKRAGG